MNKEWLPMKWYDHELLSIALIDAVGSWQKILPMPNLERAY